MHLKKPPSKSVIKKQRAGIASQNFGDIDWKLLKLFMIVAQSESLRAAAEKTGQAHNTISRKMAVLEENLGRVLITRAYAGIQLTDEGRRLVSAIEHIEIVLSEFARSLTDTNQDDVGTVVIAAIDMLSAFWLAPSLAHFHKLYPGIALELKTYPENVDVLRMEADVSIQCTRPTASGAMMRKLGHFHLAPFATQAYIDEYGMPKFHDDYGQHRFVMLESESLRAQMSCVSNVLKEQNASITSTTSASAQIWTVVNDGGIGWLPIYALPMFPNLVLLTSDIFITGDLWLTYHPDVGRIARIRHAIDWLIARFDANKHMWFRETPPDLMG